MIDATHSAQLDQELQLRLKDSAVFRKIVDISRHDPKLCPILCSARNIAHAAYLYPAAIHSILMQSSSDPLAAFFPNLGGNRSTDDADFASSLKQFVGAHAVDISQKLQRYDHVVKSDPRRAAVLRCAVAEAWRALDKPARYVLIDFGCGIGTSMLLDRSDTIVTEDILRITLAAELALEVPLRGGRPDPELPTAERRIGLDITRLDPTLSDDRNFVLGHVFPEQAEAFRGLQAAIAQLAQDPPEYRTGDTLQELEETLNQLEPGLPVILMHSMMIHCLTPEERHTLDKLLAEEGARRPLARVSFEIAGPASTLRLALNGQPPRMLGRAGYDAEWLHWMV